MGFCSGSWSSILASRKQGKSFDTKFFASRLTGVVKVQKGSALPIYAVVIASSVACVIGLINLGSSTAFNDVISLSVSSLYASYIITESFLLYRRVTGAVKSRDSADVGELSWGPFHLPGILGIAVNLVVVCFGIIIFIFSFFPVATPVTPKTMNFSSLMTGSVVLFAVLYYVIWARKEYKGPINEVPSSHMLEGRTP